jgi:IS5 family transposase
MIGLILLKYMYDLSDEAVAAQWEENICFQAFTCQETFIHKAPCHPSQLTLFSKMIKQEGCEIIFAESVKIRGKRCFESCCIADTAVQE